MKVSGFYRVKVDVPFTAMWSDILVVIEDGKIRGGDFAFTIVGTFEFNQENDSEFSAEVVSRRYDENATGVLGPADEVTVSLKGQALEDGTMKAEASVLGFPNETFSVGLVKVAEIEPYD